MGNSRRVCSHDSLARSNSLTSVQLSAPQMTAQIAIMMISSNRCYLQRALRGASTSLQCSALVPTRASMIDLLHILTSPFVDYTSSNNIMDAIALGLVPSASHIIRGDKTHFAWPSSDFERGYLCGFLDLGYFVVGQNSFPLARSGHGGKERGNYKMKRPTPSVKLVRVVYSPL